MLSEVTKKIQYQCESLSRNGQWDEPIQAQTVQSISNIRIIIKDCYENGPFPCKVGKQKDIAFSHIESKHMLLSLGISSLHQEGY